MVQSCNAIHDRLNGQIIQFYTYRTMVRISALATILSTVLSCCGSGALAENTEASASFGVGRGRYAQAAIRAGEELARQEQQCEEKKKMRRKKMEQKKKTMEEAMESAKKLPREIDDDFSEEEEISADDPPLTFYDDSDSEEPMTFIIPKTGIKLAGDEHRSLKDDLSSNKYRRRRRRSRRRKRDVKRNKSSSNTPQSSPTASPTIMPGSEHAFSVDDPESQPPPISLVGQTVLSKFIVTEQIRVGSTKSELFKCFHIFDQQNQQYPLAIKLSENKEQMELEHRIHLDLAQRLLPEQTELFVKVYDWIPPSPQTSDRAGFVMECGLENLRGYIWRHGPYRGDKLKEAMRTVIRIVDTLHQLGTIWTEVKAENLLVFPITGQIKAIDLESVAAHGECLRCYTAETYPPEFPPDSLYQALPQIPLNFSFDSWGLGLVLLEMTIGEPLFTLQRTYDVDYIKDRLKHPEGIIDEALQKMQHVEEEAKRIILKCLVVDPTKRSSSDELLKDYYFQTPSTASQE